MYRSCEDTHRDRQKVTFQNKNGDVVVKDMSYRQTRTIDIARIAIVTRVWGVVQRGEIDNNTAHT
jgi:hypothetical protein